MTTSITSDRDDQIRTHQETDPIISVIYRTLIKAQPPYKQSPSHPLNRYIQIWHQLVLENDIVCRKYIPSPSEDMVIVPILPPALRQEALFQSHDVPMAGHQGAEKTLQRLRRQAYWVNMVQDVQQYCNSCIKCQQAKSIRAPLTIGHPWQMIAIDILEVPISRNNNRVIQDYFTKWAEAIPLVDQKAERITQQLVKVCATMGLPEIVHSDQGHNFESTIFGQTLEAFGIVKTRTTSYHPQGRAI